MRFYALGLVICMLLNAGSLFGWSSRGHKLVAEIARSRLNKEVISLIDHYLDGTPWGEASCWMDAVRENPKYAYMNNWHFVHFERDRTYVKTKNPDIINQLEFAIRILKNRSIYYKDDIANALRVVFHLTGDIHQPLNCGYPSDTGGEKEPVMFLGKQSTLHAVWDNDIIEEKKITIWDCMKLIISVSEEKIPGGSSPDILRWANESRSILDKVYPVNKGVADRAYVDASAELLKLQLARAGVRLSVILNGLFAG